MSENTPVCPLFSLLTYPFKHGTHGPNMPARPGAAIDFGCEGLDVRGLHSSFVSRLLLGEESVAEIVRGPFLYGEVVIVVISRDGMENNKEGQNASKYCKIH